MFTQRSDETRTFTDAGELGEALQVWLAHFMD
jgi:hypothetical protein